MYYKLPVKERIELMKSYRKANPDMSYQDMVNDYNTSYKKFDNGGKKEREPIYVTDKNDPRIRAYKDSLDTYSFNKSALDQLYKTGKTPKGTSVDLTTKRYVTRDQGINEDYVNYKKFLPNITKKEVVGEWDYVDNYKGKLNRSTSAYKFKFKDSDGDFTLKQYQKPVQPYIYKKPEEQPIVNNTVQDSVKYLPLIKTIPTLTDSVRQPEIIQPKIIQSGLKQPEQKSTYQKVSFRYDPVSKLQVPVLLTDPKMKVEQGTRIYNKYIPTVTGALPSDFKPEFNKAEVYEKTDPYWRSKFINPNSVVKK